MKVGVSHILERSYLRDETGEIICTSDGRPIMVGTLVDRPTRVPIKKACKGYYLRWWYNGWHYWFFRPGELYMVTEGEEYRTIGTRKIVMGSGQITYNQCQAIRTIMNTREVYLFTADGWKNIRVETGSVITYKNQINGYELEIVTIIGSKEISKMEGEEEFSPVEDIPVIPAVPDPGLCEVILGGQVWACYNYAVSYPGSRVYNDNEANRAIYGGLYTWDQIMSDGFCPPGWHVPSIAEWDTLMVFLLGAAVSGGKLKEVGIEHWNAPNTGATDNYGFTMLPAGYYIKRIVGNPIVNTFGGLGEFTYLWTSNEEGNSAYAVLGLFNSAALSYELFNKLYYFPVRFIKDIPPITYNDWFLPSRDELQAMYDELYLFGVGGFAATSYHSSSERDFSTEWYKNFITGATSFSGKNSNYVSRACRYYTTTINYSLRDTGISGGLIFHKVDLGGGLYGYYEAYLSDNASNVWWDGGNILIGTGLGIGAGNNNSDLIIAGSTTSAALLCNNLIVIH